jgi:hypothetical protein
VNRHLPQVLQKRPTHSHLYGYLGKVIKDTTLQSMTRQTFVGLTACKGRVTKLEASKVLTNESLVDAMIKVIPQTPKQSKRGNLPTWIDETSCLNIELEEAPNTLVVM